MFPERGSSECRVIHVVNNPYLPDGAYALMESYCTDPDCDCRRVMLNVVNPEISKEDYLASISYGFDREEEFAGPFLDPLNPQSKYAGELFTLVKMVLADPAYTARLEAHYKEVKRALKDPAHKIHRILADARRTSRQRPKKIGRNAPCPCGSDRKYKKCCLKKDLPRGEPLQEAGLSPTVGGSLNTEEMPGPDPKITFGDVFDIKAAEIKDDETKESLLYHIRTGNCPYNKKECIPQNCPLGGEGIERCTFH
jgi:hypothetical protein